MGPCRPKHLHYPTLQPSRHSTHLLAAVERDEEEDVSRGQRLSKARKKAQKRQRGRCRSPRRASEPGRDRAESWKTRLPENFDPSCTVAVSRGATSRVDSAHAHDPGLRVRPRLPLAPDPHLVDSIIWITKYRDTDH